MIRVLLCATLAACTTGSPVMTPDAGSLPSCASAGCDRPSGSPDTWAPCTGDVCYCPRAGSAVACSATFTAPK